MVERGGKSNGNSKCQIVLSGKWVPFSGALGVGDAVRIGQSFPSDDSGMSAVLSRDALGEVQRVDEDGGALMAFTEMTGLTCCERWVTKSKFRKMLVQKPQALQMKTVEPQTANGETQMQTA